MLNGTVLLHFAESAINPNQSVSLQVVSVY